MKEFNTIIIGAGVIGSAVGRSLLLNKKDTQVAILDKESIPAFHTSGRNSGVIHSGFNLKPGSKKAKFCVEGNKRLREFCDKKNISYKKVGTLVVATDEKEFAQLDELLDRGQKNNVPDVQLIEREELLKKEPNSTGLKALFSPTGSIVSGAEVTNAIISEYKELGGSIFFNEKVNSIKEENNGFIIRTNKEIYKAKRLFNCAGLYSDQIAHLLNVGNNYTIIPFRGEYYKLIQEKEHYLNSMIYPVPDLNYPFLGVHWTKHILGYTMIGPNASLAFSRESYSPYFFSIGEFLSMIFKKNFINMWRSSEFRKMAWHQIKITLSRKVFVREARKLIPDVNPSEFKKMKAGIRAQVVDETGKMVEDMLVERKGNSIHVLNAVSPGFTCSLPFADYLIEELYR